MRLANLPENKGKLIVVSPRGTLIPTGFVPIINIRKNTPMLLKFMFLGYLVLNFQVYTSP